MNYMKIGSLFLTTFWTVYAFRYYPDLKATDNFFVWSLAFVTMWYALINWICLILEVFSPREFGFFKKDK